MKKEEYLKISDRANASKELCKIIGYDWRNSNYGIDEFKEKYYSEIKRRLSTSSEFSTEQDIETVCDTIFVESQWNRYKKIYDFNPTFIRYLAATEAGRVEKAILERLPFNSFYISFGGTILDHGVREGFIPCVGIFVYIYFDRGESGEEDFIHISMSLRGENDSSVPLYLGIKDGCIMQNATDIDKMPEFVRKWITHNDDPEQTETVKRRQEAQKPFFMIVLNACQYLCAANAELKDIKIDKKDRPIVSAGAGKKKPLNIQITNVGFRLGQQFEKMYQNLEATCQKNGVKGTHKRPHIRRAHWHRYWTGPGRTILTVKWFEPIFVMGTDEEIDIVSHEVKGE